MLQNGTYIGFLKFSCQDLIILHTQNYVKSIVLRTLFYVSFCLQQYIILLMFKVNDCTNVGEILHVLRHGDFFQNRDCGSAFFLHMFFIKTSLFLSNQIYLCMCIYIYILLSSLATSLNTIDFSNPVCTLRFCFQIQTTTKKQPTKPIFQPIMELH